MQAGDAVAATDVDQVVDDLQAKRFVEPGGKAVPAQGVGVFLGPAHDPDVPAEGAYRHAPVAEEIEGGGAHHWGLASGTINSSNA